MAIQRFYSVPSTDLFYNKSQFQYFISLKYLWYVKQHFKRTKPLLWDLLEDEQLGGLRNNLSETEPCCAFCDLDEVAGELAGS